MNMQKVGMVSHEFKRTEKRLNPMNTGFPAIHYA